MVDHESGSVAEAREARAQARAAQRSWMSLTEAPAVEMPASERKAACCAFGGTAILEDVHNLAKVIAGGMTRVRSQVRREI